MHMTFFVPRDDAWSRYGEKARDMLKSCASVFFRRQIFLATKFYSMSDLELASKKSKVQVRSLGGLISFTVTKIGNDYYLLWENQMIRAHTSDYVCSNGLIHIVDAPFLHPSDLLACR